MAVGTIEYGVRVAISAPIIIDGAAFGDFEGWALSDPDGPDLMSICLRVGDDIGAELGQFTPSKDPLIEAARIALWSVAKSVSTKEQLRALWDDEHPRVERRPFTKPTDPDASWNARKEA